MHKWHFPFLSLLSSVFQLIFYLTFAFFDDFGENSRKEPFYIDRQRFFSADVDFFFFFG